MKPIVFEGRFGWLHAGTEKRGVILCNTYGHEHVWTYQGMRYLADELSARGMWVMRFDYLGTGDSRDSDGASDQFETSVQDIHAAIDFFKQQSGIEHVTLCGFRVGAAFAVTAALEKRIDDLVLLAPVASGRTYMRELSIVRKTWLEQLSPPLRAIQQERPLNVLGQTYDDGFVHTLEAVDMASSIEHATGSPARRALIVQTRASVKDPVCDALIAHGVHVDTQTFEDFTGFIQEPAFSVLPKHTYDAAIAWMSNELQRHAPSQMDAKWAHRPVIATPEAIERPVCIGEDMLFGVVCEPRTRVTRGPVYLITNTSASAHVGDSRLSVRMARELARRGIASLRIDARGRGESPSALQDHSFASIYDSIATTDTASAARWLVREGYKTVYTFGICSGAYHALKSALIEPCIKGVVAVNLPTFKRPENKAPDAPREAARNSMAGYAISMFDPAKWLSIMRGEKKFLPMIRFVIGNLATRVRSRLIDALHLDTWQSVSPENATEPMQMMRALDAKGVKTILVHGAYDASMDVLAAHFGSRGARLSRLACVRVAVLDHIDHALFNPASSAEVIALCDAAIREPDAQKTGGKLPVGAHAVS
jgi:alpha-beta hydrolase superfamily lysophospholipase